MRIALRIFAVWLACMAVLPCATAPAAAQGGHAGLLKVVALSRHGVRAPVQSPETLALWSSRAWPQWPVGRGSLTSRGGQLVTAQWKDLRIRLADKGLLPDSACAKPGAVFVRADTDQRCAATARALLEGLCPGSSSGYALATRSPDPLFHPMRGGAQPFDPATAAADVLAAAGGSLDLLHDAHNAALLHLQHISAPVAPELCLRYNLPARCGLTDLPSSVSIAPDNANVRLSGALGIGSSMAEIFLLEYAQWPRAAAAWGQVDARTLRELLPLHDAAVNVVNRAPMIARAKGGALLSEMAAALAGTHSDQRCNAASLVVFVGHDTNLANVGALLGLHWQLPGYPPDSTPPAAVLLLELWDRDGRKEVRASVFAQSIETLHAPFASSPQVSDPEAAGRDRPAAAAPKRAHAAEAAEVTAPPVLGEAVFSLEDFTKVVRERLEGLALPPQQVPPLRLRTDAIPEADPAGTTESTPPADAGQRR
ncbi:MAG: histidine-type phosphatase [Desulfovibrio desulfuricans]|nr:histidine-type phosphatase [Desulfovibrio desulfuricans]